MNSNATPMTSSPPQEDAGDSAPTKMGPRVPRAIRSLCVFCGSSPGTNPRYMDDARKLGALLAQREITLVYGGGALGCMGAVAQSVREGGGKAIGVIPHALARMSVSGAVTADDRVVDSMHERKAMMHELADALIALPGGYGTLEELLESITWSQLRIHAKPIGVLDTDGFFRPLLDWIETAHRQGFIDKHSKDILVVRDTPEALLEALENYVDPIQGPWLLKEDMWKKRGTGQFSSMDEM